MSCAVCGLHSHLGWPLVLSTDSEPTRAGRQCSWLWGQICCTAGPWDCGEGKHPTFGPETPHPPHFLPERA